MADKSELYSRWKAVRPAPVRIRDVHKFLASEYNAYELPVRYMEPDNFAADIDVRADLVDSLYTITDPAILTAISGPLDDFSGDRLNELGFIETSAERGAFIDTSWRDLFIDDDPWEYRVLSAQHAVGSRASVLLESENGFATGFRIYGTRGQGSVLDRHLIGLIGFPMRRAEDSADGPYIGAESVDDEMFVRYLSCAAEFGII